MVETTFSESSWPSVQRGPSANGNDAGNLRSVGPLVCLMSPRLNKISILYLPAGSSSLSRWADTSHSVIVDQTCETKTGKFCFIIIKVHQREKKTKPLKNRSLSDPITDNSLRWVNVEEQWQTGKSSARRCSVVTLSLVWLSTRMSQMWTSNTTRLPIKSWSESLTFKIYRLI